MKKHRYSRSQPKKEKSFLFSVCFGAFFSLFLGILLLALFSLPSLKLEDPLRFAPIFALISLFVSSAIGAHLSARFHGKSGLACGVLSSLLLIILLVGLGFLFSLQIKPTLFTICAPSMLIISAIAGICGVKK
ncbi:MAG: TIGR04086 family membrane protein [Ruminococcaceae bacterium]|nr:TIGR04086 family membrane protein [Oscillospiraceae bacterium]